MKLSYRGVSYDYIPPQVEQTEGELAGKYRGLDWKFCNSTKQLVQQPTLELKYRGVPMIAGTVEAVETSAPEKARRLMMNQQLKSEKRQSSMLSRVVAEIKGSAAIAH